ncbi:MAG: diphosphomevalonate decarboxylase [Candidatus Aenigmarchaeota archaeon]|nr:diphosphomevalonate decarboxylase [Candidatus Aenigmarchaeota archaeon]
MKVTAVAPSNIALIKYWGRRDDKLVLPYNGSISVTLDKLLTKTTVEFSRDYKKDEIVINGERVTGEKLKRALNFINFIRRISGEESPVRVVSENNFPTAAGLASSASGFSALALACSNALDLNLSDREVSILARMSGSGSAARSLFGGFVEWHRGKRSDGSDSYAEQIANETHWKDFRILVSILTTLEKKISSADGMRYTVKTSPFYTGWLKTIKNDLRIVKSSIRKRDFTNLGKTSEHNCLKMHALMISTVPSLIYWMPSTLEVMHKVMELRRDGLECYFTIDAGPNVKVLCLKEDVKKIKKRLKELKSIKELVEARPGRGAYLSKKHLF